MSRIPPPPPRDWCESGHCCCRCCCKPLRFLSRAALLLLRMCCSASDAMPGPAISSSILGAEFALAGWLCWAGGLQGHPPHQPPPTTATALQQSPAEMLACTHTYSRPVLLPATREFLHDADSAEHTRLPSCYECRRAEWPPDGLRFGGTDKGRQAIIISPNISFVDTAYFFRFHPSIHLLFLLLSCSTIHLLSSC